MSAAVLIIIISTVHGVAIQAVDMPSLGACLSYKASFGEDIRAYCINREDAN